MQVRPTRVEKKMFMRVCVCACGDAGMALGVVCLRVSCGVPTRPSALDPPLTTTTMMMVYVKPSYACKTAHKIHLPHICKQADLSRMYSVVRI